MVKSYILTYHIVISNVYNAYRVLFTTYLSGRRLLTEPLFMLPQQHGYHGQGSPRLALS